MTRLDAAGPSDDRREEGTSAGGHAAPAWVYCGAGRLPVPAADGFEPPARLTPAEDPDWTVSCALAEPLGSPPLADIAGRALADGSEIVVTVPDASRPCPTTLLLEHVLAELERAGLDGDRVTVAIGCGLHATTSPAQRRALVGGRLADAHEVFDAQGLEGGGSALGATSRGVPVVIDRRVAEAGLVVALGIVEPHLYAGFSGGVKAVAIGCAGEATIAATHDPGFISLPGVVLGRLDGNPFQETLREVAAHTALGFAVNAVVDDEGRVRAVAAGDPAGVQATLAAAHRAAWLRPVEGPYDVIVAGVPAPKSVDLYQTTRAATYIGLQERPALADGGTIVLCADLTQGPGAGPAERNFAAVLAAAAAPAEVLARGLREPLGPGGQRAFVVARVLERYHVAVAGARDPGWLAELGIDGYATVEDARAAAEARLGRRPRVLAVADAVTTVVRQV